MAEFDEPTQEPDLLSELRSLGQSQDATPDAPAQAEPEVGVSETARALDGEGYFDALAQQFGQERQRRTQDAVEESQGWSENGIVRSVRDFFNRPEGQEYGPQSRRGHDAIYGPNSLGRLSPDERQAAAQSELETAEGTAAAARRRADAIPEVAPELRGPGLMVPRNILAMTRGLFNADAVKQETRLARAQSMLRGEAELPQYAEWRALTESGAKTVADMFTTLPIQYAGIVGGYAMGGGEFQDNRLYKFGQSVERAVQQAFPGDPARQFEYSHTLVQGLASTMAFGGQGAIAHLLGAGPKGQLALIALSGMAAQTPPEFARVTQAMERGDATERDRIIAVLANSALGATEAMPFANTIGGPQRGLSAMVARGGEQALEEMGQEALQQGGQNVTRMLTYDPKQDPYEGVLESMVVAAISGFGYGSAFSGGGRQQGERPPVVEARIQTPGAQPAPQAPAGRSVPEPAPAQPVQPQLPPQVDPALDPFNLERFAPAPVEGQDGQTEPVAPTVAVPETAAPESDLGRIAAMADRPSDTPAAPAVLPPDVLEYLRETNPELADRYDNSDISGAAPDAAAAPPLPTLRERLETLNQGRQEADPALEATVDANLPAYHADMEDVLARLDIATPLSDTDVRAVARHMARDNLTAEEALERHAVEAYEAERQARAQPETVGVQARGGEARQGGSGQAQAGTAAGAPPVQAPAAPAGGTGGQPAGARAGSPGSQELGGGRAGPGDTAAPAATGQPQRGTEQAPAAASARDAASPVTEPTPQQRSFLNRILGQKRPLKWSEVQGRLRASPEQMEALRQEALSEGLLRRDRHGVYRRTAKVAAVAEAGMPSLAGQNPNTLSIPPEVRIDNAIRIREALTGKPVSPLVRSAAIRLLAQLGRPQFTTILAEVKKDGGLKVADVRDLAALVGYPPTAKTSKADAFRLISARHLDHKGFLERQVRSQQMAAFEPARSLEEREAAARARMETPEWISAGEKPADPSLYTYNQKGYLSPEWAAERRYVGANGEEIVGVADAVSYLVEQAEALVPGGVAREKKAYLIIGFPGAGKSTIARALSKQYRAAHMVSDIPKAIIPEYDGGKNGEGVHEESSDLSDFATDELVERGDNIILETLGTWPKVAKRAAYFLSRGYQPSLVFVDIPKAIAMERAVERWQRSGRAVPLHTFDLNPQEAYANALDKGAVDEAARVTLSSDEQGWVVGEATGAFGVLADAIEEQVQARNARMVRGAGGRLAGRPDRVRRDDGGESEDGGRIGEPTDDTTEGPGNEGLPAFQAQPRPYTQIFQSRSAEVAVAIQRELERMLPADVPVRMMDRLFVGPAAADERVSIHPNGRMLLEVALSGGADVAKLKGFHGVTHILRERGLWSDKEWNLLVERAGKTGMADRLNETRMVYAGRPDTPMLEGYRAFYTQQAQSFGLSEEEVAADVAEKIDQELVAALAESWAEGTSYGTSIDSLLERIARFFEVIRNALNGLGFQTVDDIFERVASGEVARRAEGGRREPTFDPFPVKVSPEEYHLSSEEGMAAVDLLMGTASAEAMFALKGQPDAETRSFSIPGFNGSVEERVKSSGERIRTYAVKPDISGTASESDQSPLQPSQDFAERTKAFASVALRRPALDLGGGLTLVKKAKVGGAPSVEYKVMKGDDVIADALVSAPRHLSPTIGEMFDIKYGRIKETDLPFVGTVDRINVEPEYQTKQLATKILDEAENDLATVGAGIQPGGSFTKKGVEFGARWYPEAMFDALRRAGHNAYSDKMLTFARAMRELGRPVNVSAALPKFVPRRSAPASGQSGVRPATGDAPEKSGSSFIVSEQPDGSWEVSFFKAEPDAPVADVFNAIEADVGNRLSPKGWLTPQGYRYWQATDPQSVKYHQNADDLFGGMYASPRAVEFGVAILGRLDIAAAEAEQSQTPHRGIGQRGRDALRVRHDELAATITRTPGAPDGWKRALSDVDAQIQQVDSGAMQPLSLRKVAQGAGITNSVGPLMHSLVGTTHTLEVMSGDVRWGDVTFTVNPLSRKAYVDNIHLSPGLRGGTAVLREIRRLFGEEFPGVATFFGDRTTGAHAAGNPRQEIRWPDERRGGDSAVKSGTPEMSVLSRLKSNLPPEALASERNEQMFSFSGERSNLDKDGSPVLMAAFRGTPKKAKSVTGSLKGTQIEVSPELTAWLGIPHGKFQANYESIAKKRGVNPSPGVDLSDPAAVRDFVEDVLTRAEFAIRSDPNTPNQWDIVVRDSLDRVVGARLRLRGRTYSVGTALVYEPDQLDARLLGAARTWGVGGVKWKDPGAASTVLQLIRAGVGFPSGSGIAPVPVDPSTQEVIDALEQSQGGGQVLPAFSSDGNRTPPYLAPPGQVAQPASPTGGTSGEVRGLADIIADLKETLGLTTTQGRYGLTVVDRAAGRRFRFPAQSNVRGQYDRNAGVARIRIATDIDAIAHEGGHHLERVYGAELETLKQAHAEELGTPPAPNAPLPQMTPQGYSGLELDADTQGILVEAATAMREWRALATQRGQAKSRGRVFGRNSVDDAAYHEASSRAAMATGVLERRLGKPIAQALIGDILGDARIAPGVIGQSPLRRAVQTQGGTTIQEIAPEDMAAYVTERYSRTGVPQPRNVPTPTALQVSEGFAEFFRRYIVDPDTVQRDMPGVYSAFEEFLDAADPAMLENLEKLQLQALSQDYKDYRNATALERLKADTVSEADRRFMTRAKEWLSQIGQGDTWSGMASSIYEAGVDENHPHYLVTRMLLEKGDENRVADAEGRAQSLAVHENPYKLMRSVGDAFKTGLRWIQDGMPQYRHAAADFEVKDAAGKVLVFRPTLAGAQAFAAAQTDPVTIAPHAAQRSKSLHEALVLAMGSKWDIGKYENFGTYLIARRGVEEWARYMKGDLERKPMKSYATGQPADEMAAHVETIRKYGAANPDFAAAAQIVYDFLWAQAVHDFQAGRLSQAELDYRATRKHFYVPWARSMKDIVATRGIGGRVQKFSKDQRFKGSDRPIMHPIETIIDQTFHRAAATHFNDVMKAYAAIAERAGPGGAEILERVDKTEILAANNEAFRRLESDFLGLGYNADDVREMVKRVESDFGDTQLLLQWSPDSLGPVRPLMVPLWENGERKFIRINDPEWAANVYNSLNGIGRELSSLFIEVVAKPATLLRVGVTTHPAFIGPNIVRDMWQAFTLTGSVLDPRTWPGVTQVRGLYHELAQTDMARLYQEVGGIMGGQNVAALSRVRDKADVMALKEKGLQIKPVNLSIAAGVGGAVGFAVGGPIGAGVGALFGGALHRGPRHFFSDLAHFADMSETATRLGTFTSAYDAALAYNPSLTPYQAAQEAAYVSRDLIDFGRRGGKMLAAARLVPFMNANIQGLDKAVRQLLARSDRGMQLSTTKLIGLMAAGAGTGLVAGTAAGAVATFAAPAVAINLAARSAAVRALLAPFTKKDMGIPLSRDDERALGMSAKAWTNLALYSLILLAFSLLYADDDEYQAITPRVKVRNQPVKIDGEWYMFPKAFEWALPSVIIEAALDSQYRNDPRFAERVRESLFETLTPPGIPQAGRLWRDIGANYNSLTGRPIVAEHFRSDPPQIQFNAYASQFAIAVSKFVNERPALRSTVEGVGGTVFATPRFELTPAIVDYALSSGLGYWGKDAQKASNVATVGGSRLVDYPLVGTAVQRFNIDPNRANDAINAYWTLMGQEHEGYRRAAAGYKRYNEMYGPQGANTYLATLIDPEQRAYALLDSSGSPAAKRGHPLNRLKGVVTASMDMERDIALGRLADTTSPRDPQAIVLSPARTNEVRDALAAIRAVEAHNTMVVLRHRQFADRQIRPVQPALDLLRAASPEVFAEYELRARRQKVGDFADVAQNWPERREELLREWQEAVDQGEVLERGSRGRTPRRLPIGSSRDLPAVIPAPTPQYQVPLQ